MTARRSRSAPTAWAAWLVALAILAAACGEAASSSSGGSRETRVSLIVRELPGAGDGPEAAVRDLGDGVDRHIGVLDGFVAQLPVAAVVELSGAWGVGTMGPAGV